MENADKELKFSVKPVRNQVRRPCAFIGNKEPPSAGLFLLSLVKFPLRFIGMGEKMEDLEVFYAEGARNGRVNKFDAGELAGRGFYFIKV